MRTDGRYSRLIIIVLFIIGLLGTFFITKEIYNKKNPTGTIETCVLRFEVVDGFTDMPIQDAVVIIPEIGGQYKTNSAGLTDSINVPVIKDTRFSSFSPQYWGAVTALVYKEGYAEYALFYTNTKANYTRPAIKIYLFENENAVNDQPFSIIEGPDRNWVKELLNKFRPKDY